MTTKSLFIFAELLYAIHLHSRPLLTKFHIYYITYFLYFINNNHYIF